MVGAASGDFRLAFEAGSINVVYLFGFKFLHHRRAALVHTRQADGVLSRLAGSGFFNCGGKHLLFTMGHTGYGTGRVELQRQILERRANS